MCYGNTHHVSTAMKPMCQTVHTEDTYGCNAWTKAPTVVPVKNNDYTVTQSTSYVVGKQPSRSIILGPSRIGQTVRLQNMVVQLRKGCVHIVQTLHIILLWIVPGYLSRHTLNTYINMSRAHESGTNLLRPVRPRFPS